MLVVVTYLNTVFQAPGVFCARLTEEGKWTIGEGGGVCVRAHVRVGVSVDTHGPRFQVLEVSGEKEPGVLLNFLREDKVFAIVKFSQILTLNLVQRTKSYFPNENIEV